MEFCHCGKVGTLYVYWNTEVLISCILFSSFKGIGGLENHILKSATITDTVACPAFTDMYFEAAPIVRVAVEPRNAGELWAGKLSGIEVLC